MSLAFLCKKSWHTSNINNQERVWMKEEEKKQEARKTELLRKQMQEEREMEELRQLKGGAKGNERLTWMYAAPISATDADEYLMGKPKEADEVQDDQLKNVVTNKAVGAVFIEKTVDPAVQFRDDMHKIRDDPLLAIKMAEKKTRERLLDNPLKVKEFKQDLENKRMEKADRKAAKKDAKKAAKKSLKHAKKGKEESGEDVADRDDWKRRAEKDQRREPEREVKREGEREGRRDDRRRDDGGRDGGRGDVSAGRPREDYSRDRDRGGGGRDDRRDDRREERRDDGGRDRSRDQRDDGRGRGGDERRGRDEERGREVKRERSDSRGKERDDKKQKTHEAEGGGGGAMAAPAGAEGLGYGLWKGDEGRRARESGGRGAKVVAVADRKKEEYSLGGRKGLLDNGADAASKYKAARPKLTEEERLARIAAMTTDAQDHQEHRVARIKEGEEAVAKRKSDKDKSERELTVDDEATFQAKLNKDVFMDSASSMSDRLTQRKHYVQRKVDM